MATIGQALTAPESGWKRYDDISSAIKYSGSSSWSRWTDANMYNGSAYKNSSADGKYEFNFIGTKLRIIIPKGVDTTTGMTVTLDGVISDPINTLSSSGAVYNILMYEKTDLLNTMHTVVIKNNTTNILYCDAIDIDSTGRLFHPDEVTDISQLQVGKRIRCRYQGGTGTVGGFLNIGQETYVDGKNDFIPLASSATPDGDFYFIMAEDLNGEKRLIADRSIQGSITWDTLNTAGIASGSGIDITKLNPIWMSADNYTGLNYNTAQGGTNPASVVYNGQLYVTWVETSGSVNQIRVKKFDGTTWTSADGNACLNYDSTKIGYLPKPIVFNNLLYVVWYESNGSNYQIRVKKFDGTSWSSADNNTSLNYNTSVSSGVPNPIVFNNHLYIVFGESIGSYQQIRVKKFDGTNWVSADNNTSLNYNTDMSASYPYPIVFNNQLYIAWHEGSTATQIRVKKFDGTNWVSADNNTSLNYNSAQNSSSPVLYIYNYQLYITWNENNNSSFNQIRVKKFDGTNWVSADNNSTLNYNASASAFNPMSIMYNNQLYIAWQEGSTTNQIRVKKFDGTNWSSCDLNTGINFLSSKNSQNPSLSIYNNQLYVMWQEQNSSSVYQIRSKKIQSFTLPDQTTMTIRLLTGGTTSTDKDNDWDKYIVNSTLNGTITAGDDKFWNVTASTYEWTSTTTSGANTKITRGSSGVATMSSSSSSSTNAFRPMLLLFSLALNPPSNFKGEFNTGTSIMWSWDASTSANMLGYRIYNGNILVAEIPNIRNYIETGLLNGTAYNRNIVSYNANKESDKISTSFLLQLNPPTNIIGTPQSSSRILWTFDRNQVKVNEYRLYDYDNITKTQVAIARIKLENGIWNVYLENNLSNSIGSYSTPQFLQSSLSPSKTKFIKISSFSDIESGLSTEISTTTLPLPSFKTMSGQKIDLNNLKWILS